MPIHIVHSVPKMEYEVGLLHNEID